jgi:putative redox protein
VTQPGAGRPLTNSVVARWLDGWRCQVTASGFDLMVDEPPAAGGSGTGPMPTEYLLAALASCYALALSWAARRRSIRLPGLTVTATGTYDGPRFSRLQLTAAADVPADVIKPLVEPALRVCYVSNTLAAAPPIEVTVASLSELAD